MVGYQDMAAAFRAMDCASLEKAPPGRTARRGADQALDDAVGVDVAVLFPTPMLALGVHPQVEVEIALSRATTAGSASVLAPEPRLVSMSTCHSTIPTPPTSSCRSSGKEGVVGFLIHVDAVQTVHANQYMKTYALLGRDGPSDRLPRLLPLARPGAGHAQPLHLGACAGFVWYNMCHPRQLDHSTASPNASQNSR